MNDNAEKDEAQITASVMEHMASGNATAFNTSIGLLKITDPVKAQEFQEKFDEAGGRRTQSDPDVVTALTKMGANITFSNVESNIDNLSNADLKKFREQAAKFENAEMKRALSVLRGELELPVEIQALSSSDKNYNRVQLLSKIRGRLEARFDKAQKEGLPFDGQSIADELMTELGQEFDDAIVGATIRSGEQVVSVVNGFLGNDQKIESDDFDGAITILQRFKQNKDERPAGLRNLSDQSFVARIDSLRKAKEAANRR